MSAPLPPPTGFSCAQCGLGYNSPRSFCPKCGAAQASVAPKANLLGRILNVAGFFVALATNAAVLYTSFSFYQMAAVTPRGTYIRPMGLAFGYLFLGLVAPILALSLSLLGAALCRRTHDDWGARLEQASSRLSVIPLPLGLAFFHLIPTICGLKLAE